MKKLLFFWIGIIGAFTVHAQLSDLIISEYIEGSSQNKAIEIYNGTGSSVDLSLYSLKKATNGSPSWTESVTLSGTLVDGDVYVVSKSAADQTILDVMDLEDGNVINFNGDDAMGLFKNDVLIDVFGNLGEDPGSSWSVAGVSGATVDHTLVRKPSVSGPNTDWASSAGTTENDSEWLVYEKDNFSFIGFHDASNEPSSATDIVAFTVENQVGESVIDNENHTVVFEMPIGTTVTALAPTKVVSNGATINPESGVAQDFTSPVAYTITAEDEVTTQEWIVSVHFNADVTLLNEDFESITPEADVALDGWNNVVEAGSLKWIGKAFNDNKYAQFSAYGSDEENIAWLITPTILLTNTTDNLFRFDINVGYWTHAGLKVLYTNEYNAENPDVVTDLNWIDITDQFNIPTEPTNSYGSFVSAGTVDLGTYSSDSITLAFKYTGDANNNEITTYQIDNVSIIGQENTEPSTETDILEFTFTEQSSDAVIDTENHTVNIEVIYGTDVTELVPEIIVSSGATVDPQSGVAQNFTNPVTYTVTAEDEETTQDWTVMVTVAETLSTAAEILAFVLEDEVQEAVIDSGAATVNALVQWDVQLTELLPEVIVSPGAQVTPTTVQNFTSPVVYTVTAQDGETTKDWTVTVINAEPPSDEANILSFELDELVNDVVINADLATVNGTVAYGTDLTALAPVITVSNGATVTPESGSVQDFTSAVTYTVIAESGFTKSWTVTLVPETLALTSIYDIQYSESGPSSYLNKMVQTTGVVAAVDNKGIYLQDGAGAWNGVYIYDGTTPEVVVGDSLWVEAQVVEYQNLTELTNATYTVLNSGNTVAAPTVVASISDFQYEKYESILVTLNGLTCVTEVNNKNWQVTDTALDTLIVRNAIVDFIPELGAYFTEITGFGGQYGNDYQLFPRSIDDIVLTINEASVVRMALVPNPVKTSLNISATETISKIVITNVIGKTIWIAEAINKAAYTINVSDLENGIYVVSMVTKNGTIRSQKVIVE